MKLYEINQKYLEILDAIENGEIPVDCIKDTLDGVEGDFETKIDSIVSCVKNLKAEREAIKSEIKTLQARVKSKENKIDGLTEYVKSSMEIFNKKKIETSRNVISLRRTAEKLVIKDENLAKEKLTKIEGGVIIETRINKQLLKEKIKEGEKFESAELKPGKTLMIK